MNITKIPLLSFPLLFLCSGFCISDENQTVDQRSMQYTQRSKDEAMQWQAEVREKLFHLLKLDDLLTAKIALNPKIRSTEDRKTYVLSEMEIQSTKTVSREP